MKIKTKKEMNLPELIEWAWYSGIDNKTYTSPKGSEISFDEYGDIVDVYRIEPNDVFTIEVEEELKEDTKISKLYHLTEYGFSVVTYTRSIEEAKGNSSEAFYIMNDDLTMTLIWTKEKGLVG